MRKIFTLLTIGLMSLLGSAQEVEFDNPYINLTLNKGFDIACSYVADNKPQMFCYDSHTGKAAFWDMPHGQKPLVSLSIGKNWNFFRTIRGNSNELLYLLADKQNSKVKVCDNILSIASNGANQSMNTSLEQWTYLNVFVADSSPYIFRYTKDSGNTSIHSLSKENSIDKESLSQHQLKTIWDNFSFAQNKNFLYILKQSETEQKINIEQIEVSKIINRNSNVFGNGKSTTLSSNSEWTKSILFTSNSSTYILLYNSQNGKIELLQIDDNTLQITSKYKATWSTGWTNFNVIFLDKKPYLFHHKESNGLARLSRIHI